MALGFSPITQFSIAGHNRNTLMDIVLNLLPFTFYFLPQRAAYGKIWARTRLISPSLVSWLSFMGGREHRFVSLFPFRASRHSETAFLLA